MVDQSELAYRMLCRNYGAQLCYTPMLHSKIFLADKSYQKKYFTTSPEDRPLVAQFCANDPAILLAAAKLVEGSCDAIDINLGCPQRIARRGYYGAFLMNNLPLVYTLVKTLHENLSVPVFCKIRIFPEWEKTLEYAKMIERAGCQLLTIHSRTKEMKGIYTGLANWDIVKRLKKELSIPVISNGNIQFFDDIGQCIETTGADGVMSADAILKNPALFCGVKQDPFKLTYEYLDMCEKYTTPLLWVKDHLVKLLLDFIPNHLDWRDSMYGERTIQGIRTSVQQFEQNLKDGKPPVTKALQVKNTLPLDQLEELIGETMCMFDNA